jgi:hypothetical protein
MSRSMFTGFTHAGSGLPGRAARRAVTRAASLAAITLLMLGTLSGPAVAQATNTPLRAFFTKLTCNQQSDDNTWPNPDHDEPYLVIFAADLRGSTAHGRVFISQVFSDVDTGETRTDSLQFWSLDGNAEPIGSDDDYVVLAALLESDNNLNPGNIYNKLQRLRVNLATYKTSGLSRAAIASNLAVDMDLAIDAARHDYGDDPDDRIGGVFGILWGTEWLPVARSGQTVTRSALLVGNGSKYSLEFQLRP